MMNMRNNEYSKEFVYRSVAVSPDGTGNWAESTLDKNLPDAVCFGSLHRYDKDTILFSNVQHHWPTSATLTFFNIWAPREPIGIRASLDDGKTWKYSRLYQIKEGGYSDINVHDGVIFSLFEQGWRKRNKYRTRYLKLARFNLDWIKNGRDHTSIKKAGS
jgi:sialidase-1